MLLKTTPRIILPDSVRNLPLLAGIPLKHLREVLRNIRNFRIEFSPNGYRLPGMALEWEGYFEDYVDGELKGRHKNLLVTSGANYLLDVGMGGGSQIDPWYLVPNSNAATPLITWTAASWATEQQNYTEATRQAWVDAAASAGSKGTTTKATMTADTGGMTINGIGVLSVSTKGSTSGTLLSAVARSAELTVPATSTYDVGYTVTIT